jgi:hypothetical protein
MTRLRKLAAPLSALGAGTMAALLGACCGIPWLVAAIGVTGAIALARIAFLAPYLWALSGAMAIAVLLWAYRPARTIECRPEARRAQRVLGWVVLALLLVLFIATQGWRLLDFGD